VRQEGRARIAELAGLSPGPVPSSTAATRRNADAERFAEVFIALGLGTRSQAYTLWFSP
jgi:hypothetical protein